MIRRYGNTSAPPIVYVGVLGVFAMYYIVRGINLFGRAKASLRWRSVDGEITWSMVETRPRPWYKGRRRRSFGESFELFDTEYRPDIRYSYRIGSTGYEGRRLYFGADIWSHKPKDAEAYVARYRLGEKVRVFIDPARPTETVLQRGTDKVAKRYLGWAIVFGALWVAALAVGLKSGFWTK
jgi:hypothetical protein